MNFLNNVTFTRTLGNISIFLVMMASAGVVVYQSIILKVPPDAFWVGTFGLILGKYMQAVGFSQGSDSSLDAAAQATSNVVTALNGGSPPVPALKTSENDRGK